MAGRRIQIPTARLAAAAENFIFMGNNPVQRQKEAPTLAMPMRRSIASVNNYDEDDRDANDVLYALELRMIMIPDPASKKSRLRCWQSILPMT